VAVVGPNNGFESIGAASGFFSVPSPGTRENVRFVVTFWAAGCPNVNGRLEFTVLLVVAVVVVAPLSSVALPNENGGADFCSSAVFPNEDPVTDLLSTVVVSSLPIGGNKEGIALGPAKIFGKGLANFLSFPSKNGFGSASITGFSNEAVKDDGAFKFDRGGELKICEVGKKFGTLVPFAEEADVDDAEIE
jgi:hypothetical protein